jgi:cation:H+ antiporter
MGLLKFLIYLASFGLLSYGSSLIVHTISVFTKRLRTTPFIFSFFIGGLLTSVAEIAVAINAVSIGRPEIFVGSMLGGTLVLFLLVIPLMTILTGGLPVKKHVNGYRLLAVLAIIAAPSFTILDKSVSTAEAICLIVLYFSLFYLFRAPPVEKIKSELPAKGAASPLGLRAVLSLVAGTLLVFVSSRFIVEQTLVYADMLNISAFVASLVVIAIGTNLPEFAVAIKAAQSHELKAMDIAVGDFLGSAATNVVMFGIFALLSGNIITSRNFTATFLCTLLAVVCFFAFTRGKSILTVKESVVLIGLYMLFISTQFATG